VYALGCVAYECLTGEKPFAGGDLPSVLWGHLERPPPLVTERRSDLDPRVDEIVAKAMAKRPDDRYATCGEFASALSQLTGDTGLSAVLRSAEEPADVDGTVPGRGRAERRRLYALSAGIIAVLVAAGVTTALVMRQDDKPQRPAGAKQTANHGPAFEKVTFASPCSDFTGTGAIPPGKKLLVFDRELAADWRPKDSGGYYFDGLATPIGDKWVIRNILLVKDATYDVHAELTAGLLGEDAAASYISQHPGPESRLNLPLPKFDPGTQTTIRVIRPKGEGGC
jgi:hypothetical protein